MLWSAIRTMVAVAVFAMALPSASFGGRAPKANVQKRKEKTRTKWNAVRRGLLKHPTKWYREVAVELNRDKNFVTAHGKITSNSIRYLIAEHSTQRQVTKERDKQLAKELSKEWRKLGDDQTIGQLIEASRSRYTRLNEKGFRQLRQQHPKELGHWGSDRNTLLSRLERGKKKGQKTVRDLIHDTALRHPTLSDAKIAAKVSKLLPEKITGRWLKRNKLLPSNGEREMALDAHILKVFSSKSRLTGTFEERFSLLRANYPGITRKRLIESVVRSEKLQGAVARWTVGREQRASVDKLSRKQALEIDLPAPTLLRLLTPESKGVLTWIEKFHELQNSVGDGGGTINLAAIKTASAPLRLVANELYKSLGNKHIKVSELGKVLPAILVKVASPRQGERTSTQKGIYMSLALDAVSELSRLYQEEVLDSGRSESDFSKKHKVTQLWTSLRKIKGAFPARVTWPVSSNRLSHIAKIYQKTMDGEQGVKMFYAESKLTNATLLALQISHPQLFPRRSGTPDNKGFAPKMKQAGHYRQIATTVSKAHRSDRRAARGIGRFVKKVFETDILATRADSIEFFNDDPEAVAEYGEMTLVRYMSLRQRFPKDFPSAPTPAQQKRSLAKEVKQLLKENPELRGRPTEVFREMRRRHPRFGNVRLYKLGVDWGKGTRAVPRAPQKNNLPRGVGRSKPMRELYRLTYELLPPGSTGRDVARAFNRLLAERGLETYKTEHLPELGSHVESHFQTIAEILAEYATAAPKGQELSEIVAKIEADYPSLRGKKTYKIVNLAAALKRFTENPDGYPGLKGFVRKSKLRIRGRGRTAEVPRYLGGWDPHRAVINNPAKAKSLALASQYARIPFKLPLVDKVLERSKKHSLHGRINLLWIGHLLATSYPLALALREAGVSRGDFQIVGTPYGSNPAVVESLREMGFEIRVPTLDPAAYEKQVELALNEMVKRHRENQKTILVMDDGGLVARLLAKHPKRYRSISGNIKIVEQTTRGITEAETAGVAHPIVDVARSQSKKREAKYIGPAVARKVSQALSRYGKQVAKKNAVIMGGGGWVGRHVAEALRDAGAKVTVVETSSVRRAAMKRRGFDVVSDSGKRSALKKADIVIGASGKQSLSYADLQGLKDGVAIASASSKRLEFEMDTLSKHAKRKTVASSNPLVRLPSAEYQLGGKSILAIGDGWPVNFDGDVEDINPEEIQLTRAVMLLGLFQAASIHTSFHGTSRIHALDSESDTWLSEQHKKQMRRYRANSQPDPADYRRVITDVLESINLGE